MARAALINNDTNVVENIGAVGTPAPWVPGKRFLFEASWAIGQTPTIGMIYNGDDPATFSPAPEVPVEELPTTVPEGISALRTQLNQTLARLDELENIAVGS